MRILSPAILALVGPLMFAACSPRNETDTLSTAETARNTVKTAPATAAPASVPETLTLEQIVGQWRVAEVLVFKGENDVQATIVDDPAFMGQTLRISIDHVLWPQQGIGTADDPTAGTDPCLKPRLTATGQTFGVDQAEMLKFGLHPTDLAPAVLERPAYLIGCDFGDWDGATLSLQVDGSLLMTWTDGAILGLTKN